MAVIDLKYGDHTKTVTTQTEDSNDTQPTLWQAQLGDVMPVIVVWLE